VNRWVPFDPDWAEIGLIQPEFVDEIVGWSDVALVPEPDDLVAIWHYGGDHPVGYVRTHRVDLPTPEPVVRRVLRWTSQ
jgi:hypothetical protein